MDKNRREQLRNARELAAVIDDHIDLVISELNCLHTMIACSEGATTRSATWWIAPVNNSLREAASLMAKIDNDLVDLLGE